MQLSLASLSFLSFRSSFSHAAFTSSAVKQPWQFKFLYVLRTSSVLRFALSHRIGVILCAKKKTGVGSTHNLIQPSILHLFTLTLSIYLKNLKAVYEAFSHP